MQWVLMAKMAADDLIKSLLVQKHQVFIRLMDMDDIIELLCYSNRNTWKSSRIGSR